MSSESSSGAPVPVIEVNSEKTVDPGSATTQKPAVTRTVSNTDSIAAIRQKLERSGTSYASLPQPGTILTGKQEHYLKRELISQQTSCEIQDLASPSALQRFGAPFKSEKGEVAPQDSEFPILRYIFVHHVRNFPFLNQAKEKEFWQDKLQVFLESFANKHISSSEDRLEDTKRKKLAIKAEKLVELMMVSGIPTASGYEERIRFAEIEVVDRGAQEQGLMANAPSGQFINGWDVNVAGVRTTSIKRHVRTRLRIEQEYLIRVKQAGRPEIYVGRRYDDFRQMHRRLRIELPGKVLPPLPRKNKSDSIMNFYGDDSESESSVSVQSLVAAEPYENGIHTPTPGGLRSYLPGLSSIPGLSGSVTPRSSTPTHRRNLSSASVDSRSSSPRPSVDRNTLERKPSIILLRETQRVSLRASLRAMLANQQIAQSAAMQEFLTKRPILLNEEELIDIDRRKEMDERRIEEQRQFYLIARQRAAELDVHMEKFRRDVIENNGLTKLFAEIREKKTIAELSPEYKKFAEWVRIEVAATIYHLFLAEDNSPELFAQAKRIHSLVPYTVLKNIVRFTNPAAVMSQVLDLFMAQPFGARSLLQRIFGMAIHDGINNIQKSIDILISQRIQDPVLCNKVKQYVLADYAVKDAVKAEAEANKEDLLVTILKSEQFEPELEPHQMEKVVNAWVAWNAAVENVIRSRDQALDGSQDDSFGASSDASTDLSPQVDVEMKQGAELFAHLKQLLKLYLRQRDKAMMLEIIEESTTLKLFRDLFQIFYEPLVRVYKSANVYSSITDFASFVSDTIATIESAQRQDLSADPNQTVQAFIDLCARHEDDLYKFIHEVHIHDNGLFSSLMGWAEGILAFLKEGPKGGKLDMNALFKVALDSGTVDGKDAITEINRLVKWQIARKRWHNQKTRQKMASEGPDDLPGLRTFSVGDFGLDEQDIAELEMDEDDEMSSSESDDGEDGLGEDPIVEERKRRTKERERLRRSAGEPKKPQIKELRKLHPGFVDMLRSVLAE